MITRKRRVTRPERLCEASWARIVAALHGGHGPSREMVQAAKHAGAFAPERVHVVPSATFRGRDPFSLARTASLLGYGLI